MRHPEGLEAHFRLLCLFLLLLRSCGGRLQLARTRQRAVQRRWLMLLSRRIYRAVHKFLEKFKDGLLAVLVVLPEGNFGSLPLFPNTLSRQYASCRGERAPRVWRRQGISRPGQ